MPYRTVGEHRRVRSTEQFARGGREIFTCDGCQTVGTEEVLKSKGCSGFRPRPDPSPDATAFQLEPTPF